MKAIKPHTFGIISTLIVGALATAAIWAEPIESSFTLGGHLFVTTMAMAITLFFIALISFDF